MLKVLKSLPSAGNRLLSSVLYECVDVPQVHAVIGVLMDDTDPLVTVMKVEKAPQETYADIGGLDNQIQEIKVRLTQTVAKRTRVPTSRALIHWRVFNYTVCMQSAKGSSSLQTGSFKDWNEDQKKWKDICGHTHSFVVLNCTNKNSHRTFYSEMACSVFSLFTSSDRDWTWVALVTMVPSEHFILFILSVVCVSTHAVLWTFVMW